MIGVSFFRIFKAAIKNFVRNIWLSTATTVVMTITLLIVLFLYFGNVLGLEIIENVEQKVDLSLTFKDEISEGQIAALQNEIESWSGVKKTQVISSEEALEIFRQKNKDKPFIEESLSELADNPLPTSLFIVAEDPQQYEGIAQRLSAEKYSPVVGNVHYEDSRIVIERLIAIISIVKNVGIIITMIFAFLVVLIMFNTLRLAIYSFREEIDIMRLVGASRWFIRGPFLLEAILVALLSVIIASGLVYSLLYIASPYLEKFFFAGYAQEGAFNIYQYGLENWITVIGWQLAVAVGLAIFSCLIAVQRYLK